MTDQQYIDQIQHDITDRTISDVRGLVAVAQATDKVEAKTVADEIGRLTCLRFAFCWQLGSSKLRRLTSSLKLEILSNATLTKHIRLGCATGRRLHQSC